MSKIVAIYEISIIILGTFGNAFVFYVGYRNRASSNTFLFLMFMSIADIISMYWWNLSHFIESFFLIDIQNFNLYLCKCMSFVQLTSLQISAWVLVLISVERYFSVHFVSWKQAYFRYQTALITVSILSLALIAINTHVLFTFGYIRVENGTQTVQCYTTPDVPSTAIMAIWATVS
jgi:hypothetical protein